MSLRDILEQELATTATADQCGATQGDLVCGRPATHLTDAELARESHATHDPVSGQLVTWVDPAPADAIIAAPPAAPSAA